MSTGAQTDARAIINERPLSALQIGAIATTIGLNALDGFDVLSISFASPGIAAEWGVNRAALGVVLSMELLGMAAGSIFLGGLADKIGRRPTILSCLALMVAGMILAATAQSIEALSVWRILTGLGIGGMLAAINCVVAEYSNAKSRNLCLSLTVIGYPVGSIIGGSITAALLQEGDWRAIFHFGALATAAFIPLVLLFVPETPAYLSAQQPQNALARVNKTMKRMGFPPLEALPPRQAAPSKIPLADIFKPALLATTLIVTFGYFLHIIAFYFVVKWIPKIVVDMGYTASSAAGVLVWANVGGALGGAAFGLLAHRFGLKRLLIIVLTLAGITVAAFGRGAPDLTGLAWAAAIAGFFNNAGIVGLYSILAQAFPTYVRSTGTGFAIGVGRGGAALAPALAGFLFQAGYSLQMIAILMAVCPLMAALVFTRLKLDTQRAH